MHCGPRSEGRVSIAVEGGGRLTVIDGDENKSNT